MLSGLNQNGMWLVSPSSFSDYVDMKPPAGRRDLNRACHSGGTWQARICAHVGQADREGG